MTTEQRPALPSRREIHHTRRRKRTRAPRSWTGATVALSTMALTTAVATTLSPAGAGAAPTAQAGPPALPDVGTGATPVVLPRTPADGTTLTGLVARASAALARADYLATEAYAVPGAERERIATAAQVLRDAVAARSDGADRATRSGGREPLSARQPGDAQAASVEAATAQLTALLDAGERAAADVVNPGPPTPDDVLAEQVAAGAAAADELAALAGSTSGYSNGYLPTSLLCSLPFAPGHVLRCDAAQQLERLDVAFHARFGVHLEVTDSYRSYGAQAAARAAKGTLVAPPGTSNHGWGLAVDLGGGAQEYGTSVYLWLRANAPLLGWDNPGWARPGGSKPEPWHWEYTP